MKWLGRAGRGPRRGRPSGVAGRRPAQASSCVASANGGSNEAARERSQAMSERWRDLSKPASSIVAPMMARPALGPDRRVGAEVDGAGVYGAEKCGGELARVEAVLIEDDETLVAGAKRRKEAGELCAGEFAARAGEPGWEGLQGDMGLKGYANAGKNI